MKTTKASSLTMLRKPKPLKKIKKVKGNSLLPEWVVGAYDGPSDGKLSLRKGYSA